MSFGSFLKKAGHVVGTVGKYAAPVLALTGVGALPAGLIGAGSAALSKATSGNSGGLGGIAGDALKYGVADYAGAKGIEALKGHMIGAPPGAVGAAPGAAPGGSGWLDKAKGLLGGVEKVTGLGRPGGLDIKDLIGGGIAAYGAKQAHDAGSKADDLQNQRLALAQQMLAEQAPIRQAANQNVLDALTRLKSKVLAPPDLSGFANSPNPFRSRYPVTGAPA